jgi:hypothetical protein
LVKLILQKRIFIFKFQALIFICCRIIDFELLTVPHRTSPRRLIRCSFFLAAKDHASTHSPCCCNSTSNRTNSTNCSPKGVASLHAVMPFALAASFVTAAPVSCTPLRSVVLHYTPLRCIRPPGSRSLRLGHLLNEDFLECLKRVSQITTNSIHFHRKLIPLHFVSFSPLSLSRLQATRCNCCARLRCRSGCGLSCFLHNALLADTPPTPFNNQHTQAKNHASPCSVRASSLDTCFRCRHFLIVRTALFRSSFVLLAHTLPPARGLTPGRPLRSPWRLAYPRKATPLLTFFNLVRLYISVIC